MTKQARSTNDENRYLIAHTVVELRHWIIPSTFVIRCFVIPLTSSPALGCLTDPSRAAERGRSTHIAPGASSAPVLPISIPGRLHRRRERHWPARTNSSREYSAGNRSVPAEQFRQTGKGVWPDSSRPVRPVLIL